MIIVPDIYYRLRSKRSWRQQLLVAHVTQKRLGSTETMCCHCGKFGEKNCFWFTESGWMCDNCFASYINIPDDARKQLVKREVLKV